MRGHHHHHRNNNNNHNNNNNNQPRLAKLSVRGWTQSSAASNADGGVSSLHSWLEKKSSKKIVKAFRNGDAYTILVDPADVNRFTHLNGFTWASAQITVEDQSNQNGNAQTPNGPRNQQNNQNNQNGHNQNNNNNSRGGRGGGRGGNQNNQRNDSMQVEGQGNSSGADQIEAVLISVIKRRYEPGPKHLNLGGLPMDAEIMSSGLHTQPASKVFSAIFVCCETKVFETPLKREQMVETLSLAANGLVSVKDCIAAAGTFNHIKGLDLQQNAIKDVGELRYWRNKFPNLEHLFLKDNPIDSDPATLQKMRQWYPKLKTYNGLPLPAANEAPSILPKTATAALELLPNDVHPEIGPQNAHYGQPTPDKAGDQVMKEQMALRFSYETRLKLGLSEQCLQANNFNYGQALADLQNLINAGQIQDGQLWTPQQKQQS